MALRLEGRLVGVTHVEATPAKDNYPARDAHLKLDLYERETKRKNKLSEVKAPVSMEKEFDALLDEVISLPVSIFAYAFGKDGADVSYSLIEGIPYLVQDAKK